MSKIEVLTFLFQLSFLTFGKVPFSDLLIPQDYPIKRLTTNQKQILADLRSIGAIYQRKSSSRRFYPTKLALILSISTHSKDEIIQTGANDGFIVIDPNYRTYGYTNSTLQATILSLFSKTIYRLPNLVVGMITRDSVRQALTNGITADEIITYISSHAHPEMRKQFPVVPETVTDQIRLWESEKNCLNWKRGCLFQDFPANQPQVFLDAVKFAEQQGYLVWCNKEKMSMFVSEDGYEPLRNFIKTK